MQDIAPIEHAALPTAPKPRKERAPSKAMRLAINLLETGECKTQKAAAARADLSEQYLSKALKKDNIQAFIARKRAENIAVGGLQASYRYPQLVFAASEHVAEKASARLLEETGDLKAGAGTNININNSISAGQVIGYTIDMRDPREAHRARSSNTIEHDQ